MTRRLFVLLLALAASLPGSTRLYAQENPPPDNPPPESDTREPEVMEAKAPETAEVAPAQFEGYVIGMPSGQRLPGSLVILANGQRQKTDLNGRVGFTGLVPGVHEITIVAPGCRIAYAVVELAPWQTRRIGFTVNWDHEVQADEAKRRSSEGILVTAEEIDEMNVEYLSEVIRRVAPDMVSSRGQPGEAGRLRGRGFVTGQGTKTPVLVIDGVKAAEANQRYMNEIRPQDVAYVEIVKGAAGGWSYGSEGAGGVISITTKRGVAIDAPLTDPELCEIPN